METKGLHMSHEFDPVFETLGLLYSSAQKDSEEELIQQLSDLGIDGEQFYKKHMKLIDRYTQSFKKHMIQSEHMAFFFRDKDETFFLLLMVLLTENRQWFQSLDQTTDAQLRGLIGFILQDNDVEVITLDQASGLELKTEIEIIDLLKVLEVDEHMKWHLLEFMQRPKYWIAILLQMVKENIPVYEIALKTVEKPLTPLMKRYERYEDKQLLEVAEVCAPGSVIYPTLIGGLSQIVNYTQVYQGIFMEFLMKKGSSVDEKKELLIARMKALSDKSKLDILCHLKKSSKYNLELAEAMNLSASTMSHHMNVLFTCGFVGIEKKDGKVYYYLNDSTVMECIDVIKQFLL